MSKKIISKEQIVKSFQTLATERKRLANRIATKAETAQKAYHQELLKTVQSYTPKAIVQDLADLQLQFSHSIENLSDKLQAELNKLADLRTAINVQERNLKEGLDAKIAANMLFILKQEQELALKALEAEMEAQNEAHEKTLAQKADWVKEKEVFEAEQVAYKEQLQKARSKEVEAYRYQLERKYKVEEDEYRIDKEKLHYKLEQENKSKEKDWAKRAEYLASQAENLEDYKTKVDQFDEELKEKVNAARQKAIDKANREAKEAAALYDKEIEGAKKVSDFEIHALEHSIVEQKDQIAQLSIDLKEALDRVSELSIKALENGRTRPSLN